MSRRFATVVSIDGRITDRRRARISVFDNSLLYAEGLFETFLAVEDRLLFLDRHLRRLRKGAALTGVSVPVSDRMLARWLRDVATRHPSRIKQVRLTITAGESTRWTGQAGKPRVIIIAAPHTIPEFAYRLLVSDLRVDARSVFRQIKTISYALQAAALREAKAQRFDDALMLNEEGRIAEVTSANIFWMRHGVLFTPPLSAGCLEGVTRAVVLEVARKFGLTVREHTSTLAQLAGADEVFISSSLKLVAPVGVIAQQGKRMTFAAGSMTRQLRQHFLTEAGIERPPF